MIFELKEFWKGVDEVKEADLYIDADSLKALAIYILVQSKCSKLLVDILIAEEFTPEALKYTNRAYYLTVLHSAFEFIEEKWNKCKDTTYPILQLSNSHQNNSSSSSGNSSSSETIERRPEMPIDSEKARVNYSEWDPLASLLKSDTSPVSKRDYTMAEETKNDEGSNSKGTTKIFNNSQLSQNLKVALKFYKSGVRKSPQKHKDDSNENRSMCSFINPLEEDSLKEIKKKENSEIYVKMCTAEFGMKKNVRSSTKKSLPESKIKWNPFKRSCHDQDTTSLYDEWEQI